MTQPVGSSRTLRTLAEALAVFAALLAVLAGYLGLQTAKINQAKEEANADLSSLQNQFNQLQHQNTQLQAENAQLKSQLGLFGATAGPQPISSGSVRHSGQLVLADGGPDADLDSPSSDPQWQSGNTDLSFSSQEIRVYGATALYLGDTRADYGTCRGRTGYSPNSINTGTLGVGKYLCVKTDENRYSALRVVSLSASQVAFDVMTYDPPDR